MKKVLSISIAAYNIEKFIRHTLDSFIIEEIINDIEVIIVNDGSKDKTSQIAHEYQEKYKGLFSEEEYEHILTVAKETEEKETEEARESIRKKFVKSLS